MDIIKKDIYKNIIHIFLMTILKKILICKETDCLNIEFEDDIFDDIIVFLTSELGKIYKTALSCMSVKIFYNKEISIYFDQKYEIMPYTYDFYLKFFLKEKFDPRSAKLLKDPVELVTLNIKIYH
jgi:hypothetical protein